MLRLRQRLGRLERSGWLQDVPDHHSLMTSVALQQLSDEHLLLLRNVVIDRNRGSSAPLSPAESGAVLAYESALGSCRPAATSRGSQKKVAPKCA